MRSSGVSPLAAVGLLALVTACSTGAPNDTVKPGEYGPVDTGTFPNLNIPPKRATAQYTAAEQTETREQLLSARKRGTAGGSVPSSAAAERQRLAKIGRERPRDVLRDIEKSE